MSEKKEKKNVSVYLLTPELLTFADKVLTEFFRE